MVPMGTAVGRSVCRPWFSTVTSLSWGRKLGSLKGTVVSRKISVVTARLSFTSLRCAPG